MHREVVAGVNWVGFVDWSVRDFHGYETRRGSSYNAYLVQGTEKTALVDTVKVGYGNELLANVAGVTPLDQIDYVVCNHAEPDHAGALPAVMAACPQAVLVCDPKCRKALAQHVDISAWTVQEVRSGDTLDLGGKTFQFLETPLAHWPESMATYLQEDKILFSMDGFGQHYASAGRFDDEEPLDVLMVEARSYYANILLPYGKPVRKVLEAVKSLEIDIIATSHGVMWRSNIPEILEAYAGWASGQSANKVMVVYDTMWKSTEVMARAIQAGALEAGANALLVNLRQCAMSDMTSDMLDTSALAFGSPTLNNTLMPQAAALLTYWSGLTPPSKTAFAFGSSGWGKQGPNAVNDYLEKMKFDILCPPIHARYAPTPEVLEACHAAGVELGQKALEQKAD